MHDSHARLPCPFFRLVLSSFFSKYSAIFNRLLYDAPLASSFPCFYLDNPCNVFFFIQRHPVVFYSNKHPPLFIRSQFCRRKSTCLYEKRSPDVGSFFFIFLMLEKILLRDAFIQIYPDKICRPLAQRSTYILVVIHTNLFLLIHQNSCAWRTLSGNLILLLSPLIVLDIKSAISLAETLASSFGSIL